MDTFVVLVSFLLLLNINDSYGDKNDKCISYKQFEEIQSRLGQLESYERRIASMEKILQERSVSGRAIDGEGVAFSTVLSGTLHHIGLKQPIRFNSVQLNENNGYNKLTGAFTAPTDGVYLFSYFLGHANVGQMWLELMHNGNKINAGVTDGFSNYEDDQGGNVAVIRLVAGDTVWVENWHQNDSDLDGVYGFTTFSGLCPYPIEEELQERLQVSVDWQAYKKIVLKESVENVSTKRLMRSSLKGTKTQEAFAY